MTKDVKEDAIFTIGEDYFIIYNSTTTGAIVFEGIDIYLDKTPVDPNQPAAPTFDPNGGEVDVNTTVTITGDDKTVSLKYWFDDEEPTTVAGTTAAVTITKACMLHAIAVGEGNVESSTKSASFTLAPVKNTYKKVTAITSGTYVFMCGENLVNPTLVGNRCNFTTDFTKIGDEIETLDIYEFTITVGADNEVSIQGPNGDYY